MYTARFRKIVLPLYQCPEPIGENLDNAFKKHVLGIGIDEEFDDYNPDDYQVFPGIHDSFQNGSDVCLDKEVIFKIQEKGQVLDIAGDPKALRLVDAIDSLDNQVLGILVGEYLQIHGVLLVRRCVTALGSILHIAFFGYTYMIGRAFLGLNKYLDFGHGNTIATTLMEYGRFDADRFVKGIPFYLDWDDACQKMHFTDLAQEVISAIQIGRYRYAGPESEPVNPKKFVFDDYDAQTAYSSLWRVKSLQEQIHKFLIDEYHAAQTRIATLKAILPDYMKTLV